MSRHHQNYLLLAFSSILVTMFLFFIDEGYYDFRWMRDGGNWLIFIQTVKNDIVKAWSTD